MAAIERDVTQVAFEGQRKAEAGWRAAGGEMIRLAGADQAEFVKRMQTVGVEVAAKNPRLKEAYELIAERATATRK